MKFEIPEFVKTLLSDYAIALIIDCRVIDGITWFLVEDFEREAFIDTLYIFFPNINLWECEKYIGLELVEN